MRPTGGCRLHLAEASFERETNIVFFLRPSLMQTWRLENRKRETEETESKRSRRGKKRILGKLLS